MAANLDPESLNVESFAIAGTKPDILTINCCTGCVSGCGINPTAGGCASGGGNDTFAQQFKVAEAY